MTDSEIPAAETPRKKADVWALERGTPPWALAAARLVHVWAPSLLLTQREFDQAIARVRAIECR